MRVLVTGGSGFLGQSLVPALLRQGWEVVCFLRRPDLAPPALQGTEHLHGDLTDSESVGRAAEGCELVFHLGALYRFGARPISRYEAVNVQGTRHVLDAVKATGARLIYCSTAGALGWARGRISDERTPHPGTFASPYEESKWRAQQEVDRFAQEGGEVVTVYPGGVFGPNDRSQFGGNLARIAQGRFWILPPRNTPVSWVFVRDVAQMFVLAAEHGKRGEGYIVADEILGVQDFLRRFAQAAGRRWDRRPLRMGTLRLLAWAGETAARLSRKDAAVSRDMVTSLERPMAVTAAKARRELGWQPTPFSTALQDTLEWHRQQARLAGR